MQNLVESNQAKDNKKHGFFSVHYDIKATVYTLLALTCWSMGPLFIKQLTFSLDSWSQNFLRYTVAALFLSPYLIFAYKKGYVERAIWKKAIPPAMANILMQSLWASAFYYANPGLMVLLSKSSILWIAGFSFIFFPDERPLLRSKRFWTGFLLALCGIIGVMFFKKDFAAKGNFIGIILTLLASVSWAVYTISAKAAFKGSNSVAGFSVLSIYTAVALAILAFAFGEPAASVTMGLGPWSCVVISGIVAIAISHTTFYAAMKRIGATIPSLIILAQPFFILLISRVLFGETLNLLQWSFGFVLIIGAGLSIWAQGHLRNDAAKNQN